MNEGAMPIYEFYCRDCHTIFSFFSKAIDTTTCPRCPKCKVPQLTRQVSLFAFTGKARESGDMDDLPIDEARMEKAMAMLGKEAENLDENDPRQAAGLMRRLSDMTGLQLGNGMEEALARMESGEDPDAIESEMGDLLESEEPFLMPGKKKMAGAGRRTAPRRDETLYDLNTDSQGDI
jgi:putative FmdB family regulatory protein